MDLSIVTPVYNDPRLQSTLESILSQRGVPEVEMIVVDGGSTDETTEIIEAFDADIDVLISEPDEGIYDAMNKGIRVATGDVVGILNADDRYQDEYVLRDVRERMLKTGAQTCYGDLVYVDDSDAIVRYWQSGAYSPRRFSWGWLPPHPTFFVKREVYEQYGLFELKYDIAADYELMLRLLCKHDISATYVDRILVRMATGGTSNESISNILKVNWEVSRAWRKNDLGAGLAVAVLKPLRGLSRFFRRPNES